MNIVFVGAQGTGKTTLSEVVSVVLGNNYNYIPEGARDILKKHLQDDENHSLSPVEKSIAIQEDVFKHKQAAWQLNGNLVADRGMIDGLAYTTFWLSREEAARDLLDRYHEAVEKERYFWDYVFLVPPIPGKKIEDDGVRSTNENYQRHIHWLITGMLQDYDYDYHVLYGDTVGVRLRECLKIINAEADY